MIDLTLDPVTEARLVNRFGPGFHDWSAALPGLLERLSRRWDLEVVASVAAGGTSRAFHVRRAGGAAVLKLTPDPEIGVTEATALRAWAGNAHVVSLIDSDGESGALLLEAVEPGDRVGRLPIEDAATLLRHLRLAEIPEGALPTLRRRIGFLFELTVDRWRNGPAQEHLDPGLIERCRSAALTLASDGPAGLVHGDLHPGNVLVGDRHGLVVIDPRPSIGDPAFDAVDWVLARATEVDEVEGNVTRLAALVPALDPDRLMGWCRAAAVMIAVSRLNRGLHDQETRLLTELAEASRPLPR
ncbi:aminoglycoside O-phosphotransferase [Planobispora rosea]|uniref:Aminoglycoside O-phosphotransferase n=1 Tax=Planobispora rosea TaxID=35762 RepID=A0A8J3S7Y9_PLARO|nr:aminoglycoside phosphotransferase family protein [Planobispora rosea]GGS57852.1 aminoglycoside O-phosphotransferase [Planobispora rosea]GIH88484.1 aminoglycoside O-phosphotransferase [Planobispora rosea]